MANRLLAENEFKNILFDVLDGIPASSNESEAASNFRSEIEKDNRTMEFRAEELGFKNVLFEFSSDI
tara:strand:- start:571 stop:771 length:201 start_codon:yes stop_codon:yes gene_type:complete